MSDNSTDPSVSLWPRIKEFLDETDIRVLVFTPPIVGFGGLLLWALLSGSQSGAQVAPSVASTALGITSLITSLGGFAEVYRKEMPGPLGGVTKGNIAIISGILIILVFGTMGLFGIVSGIREFIAGT